MMERMNKIALMGALACGLSASAMTQSAGASEDQSLRTELQALRTEVAELRAQQNQDWMTERRAEEVKTLVREVLSDADTRASLLQEGMTAGYDDGFFLAAPDDSFLLEIGGQMQFRWIENHEDDRGDEDEHGFQVRRARVGFSGHIADPRLEYEIVFDGDRDNGTVDILDFVISYQYTDTLEIAAGKYKLPFARQELLSSKRQLAVDRGSVNEFFTLDRSEQVSLTYADDTITATGSINDGANTEYSDYDADPVEFATTGRVDIKLQGEWDQARDVVAWEGEPTALFLGGAAHYEAGDGNNAGIGMASSAARQNADYVAWTLDGLYKANRLSVLGAVYGGHISWDDNVTANDRDMYGALAEAGYLVNDSLQPFVRYEWLDDDTSGSDGVQLATAGFNYFLNGHAAKFTTDVVWAFDGDIPAMNSNPFGNNAFSDGLGLNGFSDDADHSIALRSQFQLLF